VTRGIEARYVERDRLDRECLLDFRDLLLRMNALHCREHAVRRHMARGRRREGRKVRERARDHDVEGRFVAQVLDAHWVGGRIAQPELDRRLGEERGFLVVRIDHREAPVRARDRERYAGNPAAGADVQHAQRGRGR
jgi:hypothetical protein